MCVCVCDRTEGMISGVRMGMCYVILSMSYLKRCCFGMFAFYVYVIYSFDILVFWFLSACCLKLCCRVFYLHVISAFVVFFICV